MKTDRLHSPCVLLPAPLERALWDHARRENPRECVGALGGKRQSGQDLGLRGECWCVEALYPLPNLSPDPERAFLADPGHLVRALRSMEEQGQALVGLYHSHPVGPARPSATDVRLASYDVPYLIADLSLGSLGAFLLPSVTPLNILHDLHGESSS